MSDLIRRQDAELILAREMYATSLEAGCDPVSPVDFLPEARAWLSDAPTIGGWIPCSERLPEVSGLYLVTTNAYGVWAARTDSYSVRNKEWKRKGDKKAVIIAWMPLPEPYEEEDDDTN
jgi:hypothetical protein